MTPRAGRAPSLASPARDGNDCNPSFPPDRASPSVGLRVVWIGTVPPTWRVLASLRSLRHAHTVLSTAPPGRPVVTPRVATRRRRRRGWSVRSTGGKWSGAGHRPGVTPGSRRSGRKRFEGTPAPGRRSGVPSRPSPVHTGCTTSRQPGHSAYLRRSPLDVSYRISSYPVEISSPQHGQDPSDESTGIRSDGRLMTASDDAFPLVIPRLLVGTWFGRGRSAGRRPATSANGRGVVVHCAGRGRRRERDGPWTSRVVWLPHGARPITLECGTDTVRILADWIHFYYIYLRGTSDYFLFTHYLAKLQYKLEEFLILWSD